MIINRKVCKQLINKFENLTNMNDYQKKRKYSLSFDKKEYFTHSDLGCSKERIRELLDKDKLSILSLEEDGVLVADAYVFILDTTTKGVINESVFENLDVDKKTVFISFATSILPYEIKEIFLDFVLEFCKSLTQVDKVIQIIQSESFNKQEQHDDIYDYFINKYKKSKNLDDDIEKYRMKGWKISKIIYNYFTDKPKKYGILIEYDVHDTKEEVGFNEVIMSSKIENNKPLMILIHPLSGDVSLYRKFANLLLEDMNVIAIKSKGLDISGDCLKNIESMANLYLDKIITKYPGFKYNIFGFSFGGLIAYELAQKMEKIGLDVQNVIMVETLLPKTEKEKKLLDTDKNKLLVMNAKYLLLKLESNKALDKVSLEYNEKNKYTDLMESLCEIIHLNTKKIEKDKIKEILENMTNVHMNNLKALREYNKTSSIKQTKGNYFHLISKNTKAISETFVNPYYLENIQKDMGGLYNYFSNFEKLVRGIKVLYMDFHSHMDIFSNNDSIEMLEEEVKKIIDLKPKKFERNKEIAIIGASGRFPDGASLDDFWENLVNKKVSLKSFPEDRNFNINDYYDPELKTPKKTYLKKGGFLEDIELFDSLFFNISPKEAEYMDPSERIFLEESWKAIEDAGYNPFELSKSNWGVFSCAKGDYNVELLKKNPTYYMPTDSNANGRLSYYLDLKGPSMNIDTACSSGLTAISIACDNIALNNCEGAIVGGGGINSSLNTIISSSQSLLFSPSNSCTPFDQKADGTVIGEAICTIILKEKEKAIKDGDYIYGVIKGWGINQDGKTNGLTAPNGKQQYNLREDVLKKANIKAENISYIETHGTGTNLGDRIEFDSLKKTFEKNNSLQDKCVLGSVKANIGHTFFASGLVSLAKIILSFKNKTFPPQASLSKVHKDIDLENSPFTFLETPIKWEGEKLCGINSFGATGTNAHILLSSYENNLQAKKIKEKIYAFPVSANTLSSLKENVKKIKNFIKNNDYNNDDLLNKISYVLQVGRASMKYRIGFLASNLNELNLQIDHYLKTNSKNTQKFNENNNIESKELLEKWLAGKSVDWSILHEEKVKKIPIPTYEFHPQNEKNLKNVHLYEEIWSLNKKEDNNINKCTTNNRIFFLNTSKEVELVKKIKDKGVILNKEDINIKEFKKYVENILKKEDLEIVYQTNFKRSNFNLECENIIRILKYIVGKRIKLSLVGFIDDNRNHELLIGIQKSLEKKIEIKVILFEKDMKNYSGALSENNTKNLIMAINSNKKIIKYQKNSKQYYLNYKKNDVRSYENVIKEKGTYVLIGGLGGLGKIISKYLSEKYKGTIIIIGRKKFNGEINNIIKQFNSLGGNFYYYSADVTNLSDFSKTVKNIKEKFPNIRGVFNLAGIANKSSILNKDLDDFHKTIDIKRIGNENIKETFENIDLDFICNFSSTSAILGDFGVVDYTVANRFLSFKDNNKIITIHWPLWKNGGMTLGEEQDDLYLSRTGQEKIDDLEGMHILEMLLFNNYNNIAVFKGNEKRISKLLNSVYFNLNKETLQSDVSKPIKVNNSNIIENEIIKILKKNQGILDDVFLKDNLKGLGVDSINMFDIVKKVNNLFHIDITVSELVTCETVDDLVDRIKTKKHLTYGKMKGIVAIISDVLAIPPQNIREEDNIYALGIDSINMFDITKEINKEFDVNVNASELINLKTVGNITEYIKNISNETTNIERQELKNENFSISTFKEDIESIFYGGENIESIINNLMED
ncbi:SDR family NAD(P)-dependent oxidoreductase [Staphylococcus cohnii]